LSRGFWMGKYEATQGQWKRVVGEFPRQQPPGQGDDFPVCEVSYAEAEEFCRKLTECGHKSGALPNAWEFRLRYEPERRADHIGFRVVAVQRWPARSNANLFFRRCSSLLGLWRRPSGLARGRPKSKVGRGVGRRPEHPAGAFELSGPVFESSSAPDPRPPVARIRPAGVLVPIDGPVVGLAF
jgi:hypothetical protein